MTTITAIHHPIHRMITLFTALLLTLFSLPGQAEDKNPMAAFPWVNLNQNFAIDQAQLPNLWTKLHAEDLFTFPTAELISARFAANPKLAALYTDKKPEELADALQKAYVAYHNGQFESAYQQGIAIGQLATNVTYGAVYLNAYYQKAPVQQRLDLFRFMAEKAEAAIDIEPENSELVIFYCYVQGRFLEEQPFKAGLIPTYSKINGRLKDLIAANPDHLGARLILAVFHAEGAVKAPFLSKVRFGSTAEKAKEQFTATLTQFPESVIGHLNHGVSLTKMNDNNLNEEARAALGRAVALTAFDANSFLARQRAGELLSTTAASSQ